MRLLKYLLRSGSLLISTQTEIQRLRMSVINRPFRLRM